MHTLALVVALHRGGVACYGREAHPRLWGERGKGGHHIRSGRSPLRNDKCGLNRRGVRVSAPGLTSALERLAQVRYLLRQGLALGRHGQGLVRRSGLACQPVQPMLEGEEADEGCHTAG